jgi:hypothetical protein
MTTHALPPHRLWDMEAGCLVRCSDPDCRVEYDGISHCNELACPECGASRIVRVEDGLEPIWFCQECDRTWLA